MSNKVRLAVVGTGSIGAVHAERAQSNPATELTVLCGMDDGAVGLAQRLGAPLVTDFRDVASHAVDGVIVATPNQLHHPMTSYFIERGLPVLVEKPIADTLSAGLDICAAGSGSEVPILVGHHRRHSSLVRRAREVIATDLGRLIGFSIMVAMHKPDSYYEPTWRRQAGAGPLLVNLIHEVDLVRFMCGEIIGVQAVTRRLNRSWDFDDTAAVVLHLEGGAVGTVFVSESTPSPWSWESSASDAMGFYDAGQDYAYFMGDQGSLSFPSLGLWAYDPNDGEPGWFSPLYDRRIDTAPDDPYSQQIAHFAQVIRRETAPLVSAQDGLRSLAVIEAVIEAGRTGALVDVDSVIDRARGVDH